MHPAMDLDMDFGVGKVDVATWNYPGSGNVQGQHECERTSEP